MEAPIRTGIIGYGYAGRRFHAYLMGRVPEFELAGVASRSKENRARAEADHGVRTFADYRDLLAWDGIDLVVVALPHDLHAEATVAALEAGKHVVCEKIMAMTTAECDAMIAAAQASHRMLSIFHNRRWDMDYRTMLRVMEQGWLGEVFRIETAITRYLEGTSRSWRGMLERSGGFHYDWGAHLIDHGLQIWGRPAAVACHQVRPRGGEAPSHITITFEYADERRYIIELSDHHGQPAPRWHLIGQQGNLLKSGLDPLERYMNQGRIQDAVDDPEHYARLKVRHDGLDLELTVPTVRSDWTDYYRNVAAHLLHGEELAVTAESARDAVAVANAADEAAAAGQAVAPDFT